MTESFLDYVLNCVEERNEIKLLIFFKFIKKCFTNNCDINLVTKNHNYKGKMGDWSIHFNKEYPDFDLTIYQEDKRVGYCIDEVVEDDILKISEKEYHIKKNDTIVVIKAE